MSDAYADMLAVLLKERDSARAEAERLTKMHAAAVKNLEEEAGLRREAQAEVERLKAALIHKEEFASKMEMLAKQALAESQVREKKLRTRVRELVEAAKEACPPEGFPKCLPTCALVRGVMYDEEPLCSCGFDEVRYSFERLRAALKGVE